MPTEFGAGAQEEAMREEDVMENAKFTYEVFIQNTLDYTSHSVQWLPKFE